MPFAALVIIHLDIMISFFSFYSSPKHITKKKKIILSFVQVHIQWDLLRAVFVIIPLDFINVLWPLVILQWADGSLKLENSSLKNLYSHTAEKPETDFTYSIFYRRHSECISQLETRVKSHNSTCEIVVLHTIETCIFNHGFELLLQRKKNKGTND